jgi:hypothetical protein
MQWGPSAQTDRDFDLIFDEDQELGSPIALMLAPEITERGAAGKKMLPGRWTGADDEATSEDPSVVWTDWSLGMTFGRVDRIGRGGYSWGLGLDARDPRRLMPGGEITALTMPASGFTHAPIRDFAQFGSHVYVATGPDSTAPAATSDILRIVDSDTEVVVSGRYPSDTAPRFSARSLKAYRDYLWVGGYNGLMRRRMNDLDDPDAGPLDDTSPGDGSGWQGYTHQRVFLAKQNWKVAGIQDFYLIANDTESTMVYTSADPSVAGNWSSPTGVIQGDQSVATYVGDDRYAIKSIGASNHRVWFGKGDGVWDISSDGYAANATPFVEDTLDDTNCQAMYYHDGQLYFWTAMGLMRMPTNDRVRIDVPTNVQPGLGRPVEGPIYGTVTCNPTSDNGWLVVPIYNGRDSFLIYGMDPAVLGLEVPVPMIWHGALAVFRGRKITALGKTTQTGWPYLLVGLWDPDAETASISKMQMLKNGSAYQSWQHDDSYRFQTEWTCKFTGEDLGLPNTRKAILRGESATENTSTARKVEVYTAMDNTVYAEQTSAGDPFYVLIPPLSGTYTLTLAGLGTTAAIAYDDGAADIEAALEAVSGVAADNVTVTEYGERSFKVALVDLSESVLLTASGTASLAFHLLGTAMAPIRQAFVPSTRTPTGYAIGVRVEGTGTPDEPAMLTSLKYRLALIEDQLEEKEYTILIGTSVKNRHGTDDDVRNPLAVLARLVALMSRGSVSLVNEHGRTVAVKVMSGLRYIQEEQDGGYRYRVTFRVKIQRQPFYWGDGAVWADAFNWN